MGSCCVPTPFFNNKILKFIVSNPAVTCAIPATSRQDHLVENMGAMQGVMPDTAMRQRMIDYVESL